MFVDGRLPDSILVTNVFEIVYFVLPTQYSICPSFSVALVTTIYMPFFRYRVSAEAIAATARMMHATKTHLLLADAPTLSPGQYPSHSAPDLARVVSEAAHLRVCRIEDGWRLMV